MGGDINICASILISNGRIVVLYIVNLIGSVFSVIACLLTLFTYLYRTKKGLSLNYPPTSSTYRHLQYLESKQPLLSKADQPDSYNRQSTDSLDPYSPCSSTDSISSPTTHTINLEEGNIVNNNHDGNNNNNNNPQHTTYTTVSSTTPRPKMINRLIFFLTLADFIACSGIIFAQANMLVGLGFSKSFHFCIIMRCIIHFGFLSSFLWTNCIAFYLLREAYDWKAQEFPLYIFHIISWGIPLVAIVAFASGHFIAKAQSVGWCTVSPEYQLFVWFIPLVLSALWNLLCYILIYRKFKTILSFGIFGSRSHQLQRHIAKKLSLYLSAFIICWLPDLINHTIFLFGCPPYPLWILQDLFSPLQGFLNFIVYAMTNRVVMIPWRCDPKINHFC